MYPLVADYFYDVLEHLALGLTAEEILEDFDYQTIKDIQPRKLYS